MFDDMYRELILDHARNPRKKGLLEPHDITYHDHNPNCGDEIRVTLTLDDEGKIIDVGWDGQGCAISQAAASMLYETLPGKTLEEVKAMDSEETLEYFGLESLTTLRRKCALLSLKVLKASAYGLEDDDA